MLRNGGVVAAVTFGLLLSGCAAGPSGVYRDAKVSDAAGGAGGETTAISSASSRSDEAVGIGLDARTRPMMLDMSFAIDAVGGMSGSRYGVEYSRIRYTSGSLADGEFVSFYSERLNEYRTRATGYRFVYGTYSLPQETEGVISIDSVNSLSLDGFMKLYRDDFFFFTAPYVLVSAGIGTLHWDYRTSVTDTSGYSFSHDSLDFVELKAGLGGELGKPGRLQLSAYAGPVGRVYLGRTSEGFRNDLFDNRLDITWGATFGLHF